ncbi:hypothetical protein BABINDRAFT_174942 [Babjeviella inositovora NRRL Y-12698]|uniref:Uncharacterized protein n=1 Tax=Babjeviella inositovora NRRL Y-12698 TaxID=984486 RepID=A0A1E3QU27_9ASCO|nr:uncharacterized protein BABINDRAFT_174942 [Babjeviella inositovora NRRL Y-12698]ODQ81159.1 hypothetical protein BABINDRAFT_174942 [Babjeviella inositovora NRRL Y-12698]
MLKFLLPPRTPRAFIKGVYADLFQYYAMRLRNFTPKHYLCKFFTMSYLPPDHYLSHFRKTSPAFHVQHYTGYDANDAGFSQSKNFYTKSLVPRSYAVYRLYSRRNLRDCLQAAIEKKIEGRDDSKMEALKNGVYCFTVDIMARPNEMAELQTEIDKAVQTVYALTPDSFGWVSKANARVKPQEVRRLASQNPKLRDIVIPPFGEGTEREKREWNERKKGNQGKERRGKREAKVGMRDGQKEDKKPNMQRVKVNLKDLQKLI